MTFRVPPGPVLELLNGAGMILGLYFLAVLSLYLYREHCRRGLRAREWLFKLPPSMHFAVAVYVFVSGVTLRAAVAWDWRAFLDAGPFSAPEFSAMMIAAAGIVIGGLCMIRSISKPDYGDRPWLSAALLVAIFFAASALLR